MNSTLATGIRNARNVGRYIFGSGSIEELADLVEIRKKSVSGPAVFLIDAFFEHNPGYLGNLPV